MDIGYFRRDGVQKENDDAHRRMDQGHLHLNETDDAPPQWVVAETDDDRQNERQRDQDRGHFLEKGAEKNVNDGESEDDAERREMMARRSIAPKPRAHAPD